jgi:hypothetical protein
MNINGWQRIGVVISVAWLLISCSSYLYELHNYPSAFSTYLPQSTYQWIDDYEKTNAAHEEAKAKGEDFSGRFVFLKPTFSASGLILLALFPIVFGWLVVYLFIYTYRWVKHGFET